MIEFSKNTIDLFETSTWIKYNIDSYSTVWSKSSEKTYIQAWLHGIELLWTPAIYEFMDFVKKTQNDLNLVLVPIANPFSADSQIMWLQTWYNNIHTNQNNCLNYNRLWSKHSSAFESKIIEPLVELSKDCWTVIDLHCSWVESMTYVYCHESLVEDAKAFWIKDIISWDEAWSAFEDINYLRWKKAFTLELWPSRSIDSNYINMSVSYLTNFVSKTPIDLSYRIWNQNQLKSIFAPQWWYLVWNMNVGEYFNKWQKIGTLYTRSWKQDIIAEYDWLFLIKNFIHTPYENQEIAQVLSI